MEKPVKVKDTKNKSLTWGMMANLYGCDVRTLRANCRGIMERLNACVNRDNYRLLTAKQVDLIVAHIGPWKDEE